jgi:hypothetical protein
VQSVTDGQKGHAACTLWSLAFDAGIILRCSLAIAALRTLVQSAGRGYEPSILDTLPEPRPGSTAARGRVVVTRQKTIQYMREHREEFEQSVPTENFDSYVNSVLKEGTCFDGQIELLAAASTFNVRIWVFGRSEARDKSRAALNHSDMVHYQWHSCRCSKWLQRLLRPFFYCRRTQRAHTAQRQIAGRPGSGVAWRQCVWIFAVWRVCVVFVRAPCTIGDTCLVQLEARATRA